MPELLLFKALVLLDRLGDPECSEIEHYELDHEIQRLHTSMRPCDAGYFDAILDLCKLKASN